ncbi:MAG: lipopolysaccharide biosynthesis protein [Flavobacteriia bacterium]|nr:lipopolysaccharide biosynthesis protein [Flavobacteriia bacterium]
MSKSNNVIKEIFLYLLLKWKIVISVCIIGGGIGLLISLFNKPKFESKLSFSLDSSSISSGSIGGGIGNIASSLGFGGTTGESLFEGDNLIELMKSKNVIIKSFLSKIPYKKHNFVEEYINTYELRSSWEEKSTLKNIKFNLNQNRNKFSYEQDSILFEIYESFLEKNIKIKQISNKINIINITVKTKSHVFTRYFPEILIKNLIDFYTEVKTKKAKLNYDVLKKQTDSIRVALNNAISSVAASNDNIFGLNPSMNIQRVPSLRKQVDIQANTAILNELVKNLELARISLLNNTPIIQLIDVPRYPVEKIYTRKLYFIFFGGLISGIFLLVYLYFSDINFKKILKSIKNE